MIHNDDDDHNNGEHQSHDRRGDLSLRRRSARYHFLSHIWVERRRGFHMCIASRTSGHGETHPFARSDHS